MNGLTSRASICLVPVSIVGLLMAGARPAQGQGGTPYAQAYLRAPHNGAFAKSFATVDRLFNAFEYQQSLLFETLWRRPALSPAVVEKTEFERLFAAPLADPPRFRVDARTAAVGFSDLVPELQATLDWSQTFQRQVYDALASRTMSITERDGRIAELVAYYRSRSDLALTALPKSIDLADGQAYSLEFRRKFPRLNGSFWARRWLEAGMNEQLMVARRDASSDPSPGALLTRFRQLTGNAPLSTPVLAPLMPAVAPEFSRRYPEAAAIIDNRHMLEDAVASILVAREVPRSAKRQAILRAIAVFRSDTTAAIAYEEWLNSSAAMGANNMGGPTVNFDAALPTHTVAPGTSMAGMFGSRRPARADDAMAMDHAGMSATPQRQGGDLKAIYDRMMADPVIRERVATDPVLQKMITTMPPVAAGQAMGGMKMPDDTMAGMVESPEQREAIEFIVRLLADPDVEARIQSSPQLRRLRSDPEVVRRIAEMRRTAPAVQKRPQAPPARTPPHH